MPPFKSRRFVIAHISKVTIHKEWINRRNHIISFNGTGMLAYQHTMIMFKAGDLLFIPKEEKVRLTVHSLDNHPIQLIVYRHNFGHIESSQKLMAFIQLDADIQRSPVTNKHLAQKAIAYYLENNADEFAVSLSHHRVIKNKVKEMICENLKYKWSVDDICNRLFISKATLYRALKKQHVSFATILIKERLDAAKRQLGNTNFTIEKIAFECGFKNQSYFTKQFRQYFGITPTQYRRSI